MGNLKRNDTDELIYKTETDSQTKRMNLWSPGGRIGRRDSQGIWDGHVHTAGCVYIQMYKQQMDKQQCPTIYHREHCSVMWQPGWGGVWARMDTGIYD